MCNARRITLPIRTTPKRMKCGSEPETLPTALGYGLRGLDTRHDHFSQMIMTDPKAAVAKMNKDDMDLLYWTGVSWMAAISIGKDDPELVAEFPRPRLFSIRPMRLIRLWQRIASWVFDYYEAGKPVLMVVGEKGKEHFDRGWIKQRLSVPPTCTMLNGWFERTESSWVRRQLNKALDIDADQNKSTRLVNLIMQSAPAGCVARWHFVCA